MQLCFFYFCVCIFVRICVRLLYFGLVIGIIMAAVCNRAGHYIFALWFLLSSSFFFPRLISAVGEWMSTILLYTHGVALVRIWNAGQKCTARRSLEMQDPKIAKNRNLRNFVGLYLRN